MASSDSSYIPCGDARCRVACQQVPYQKQFGLSSGGPVPLPAILIACSLAANNIGGGSAVGIVSNSFRRMGDVCHVVCPGGIDPQKALSTVIFSYTPPWVSGIVCAAIIAATMSSADTDMLCASIIIKDIYQKYFNPAVPDSSIIRLTRISNSRDPGILYRSICIRSRRR